jgi:hypothetical protein
VLTFDGCQPCRVECPAHGGAEAADFGQDKLVSDTRSRLNTVFMTLMFLGGGAGAALATFASAHAGWTGVSALGAVMAVMALAIRIIGLGKRT